ncbi:MAG: asparagine synthase (glutamine-hydrolyzing) [Flammeovirgaceae bacterium]|jgi:asparagine synthase (glutamine-hydrolysing)
MIGGVTGKKPNFSNHLKFAFANKYPLLGRFAKSIKKEHRYKEFGYLNSELFDATYKNVLPTLLRNYDRYAMMNSVEIRIPFLDYRLLKMAFSLPYSSKVRGGYTKAIVRDALEDLIPEKVVRRKQKIGFNAPMDNWLGGKLKDWINDELESNDFRNSELDGKENVKNRIQTAMTTKGISFLEASSVFELLTPYIWEKSVNVFSKIK